MSACDRIAHYIAMRDAMPLQEAHDCIHGIHTGTQWEAELCLSDLRTTVAEVAALKREVARLREQLLAQQWWHDAEEKALSKQPPGADRDWRRLQHKEQSSAICAALAHKEPGDEG
jgi:hypothetical protein